jgi:hypothetical protein
MAFHVAGPIEIQHQGSNHVIDWIASWNEYLIPVSRGGYSATPITYCPWCGSRLPESRREEWHSVLYGLGYSDPGEQEIPKAFETDAWWRKGRDGA